MNLRKEARGRMCTIRVPGYCNHDPETTVLCHLPNRSMGKKSHDLHGAHGCSDCHDVVDGRQRSHYTRDELKLMHLEGVIETQRILISEGKI